MMTLIYRVQDRNGRGPWRPGFSHKWVEPRADHEFLLPWYVEWYGFDSTKEMRIEKNVACGCLTIDQLRRWFTESEYENLINLGYLSYEMKADRVLWSSKIQCVFTRRERLTHNIRKINLWETK